MSPSQASGAERAVSADCLVKVNIMCCGGQRGGHILKSSECFLYGVCLVELALHDLRARDHLFIIR